MNGTRNLKKVCCACGRSSVFTKTPLSHQILQARIIVAAAKTFLFFISFLVIFFHDSALEVDHAGVFLSELYQFLMSSSLSNLSLIENDNIIC